MPSLGPAECLICLVPLLLSALLLFALLKPISGSQGAKKHGDRPAASTATGQGEVESPE
jgi:hypothetical protein